jgi:hypothetical protein
MKKNAKIRLTLNRETLRNLAAEEVKNAEGGASGSPICYQSILCTQGCLTQTCPTNCGQWYCYGV